MLPVLLIVLCVITRVVPHPPNFAPVGATAVFAGRTLRGPLAVAIVFAAMAVSDLVLAAIHGYPPFGPVTLFIYGGFAAQVVLGRGLRKLRGGAVAAAGLGAAVFFALSNLGVWLCSPMYPHTLAGLSACFVAALPFFAATLVGDVVWTVALSLAFRGLAGRLAHRRGWVPDAARQTATV